MRTYQSISTVVGEEAAPIFVIIICVGPESANTLPAEPIELRI
jgi:hypothetical protein